MTAEALPLRLRAEVNSEVTRKVLLHRIKPETLLHVLFFLDWLSQAQVVKLECEEPAGTIIRSTAKRTTSWRLSTYPTAFHTASRPDMEEVVHPSNSFKTSADLCSAFGQTPGFEVMSDLPGTSLAGVAPFPAVRILTLETIA